MGFFNDITSNPTSAFQQYVTAPFTGGGQIDLSTAASVIPGVGQYLGTQQTNANNMQMNSANNAFNADQAQLNRDFQSQQVTAQDAFQANQSATAMQTRVADLKAAGLNPAQALGGGSVGGAQAMSGSSANGSSASAAPQIPMQNPFAGGGLSQILGAAGGIANLFNTLQDTEKKASETSNLDTQQGAIQAQILNLLSQNKNIDQDTLLKFAQTLSEKQRPSNITKDTALKSSDIGLKSSQTTGQNSTNALLNNDLPASTNRADTHASWWGRFFDFIEPAVNSAGTLSGAASNIKYLNAK